MRAAPTFQLVMMPSRLLLTMASSEESTMAASRRSGGGAEKELAVGKSAMVEVRKVSVTSLLSNVADPQESCVHIPRSPTGQIDYGGIGLGSYDEPGEKM